MKRHELNELIARIEGYKASKLKIDRIKEELAKLSSLPTLTQLRGFLASLKELLEERK